MDRGGCRSLSNAVYIREYIKGVMMMFKEKVYDRDSINSAMDALDRLGKEYEVRKIQRIEKITTKNIFTKEPIEEERENKYWVIEEK